MTPVFFDTDTIRLSMRNPETGKWLKANVYTLEGVVNEDGSLREMSVGQLVMAICLLRATTLENDIVTMMEKMAEDSDDLDVYAEIEEEIANWQSLNPNATLTFSEKGLDKTKYKATYSMFVNDGKSTTDTPTKSWKGMTQSEFLEDTSFSTSVTSLSVDDIDLMMTDIESKMDALNTISQEDLIEIQSQTAKRDDTYSLISNVLKSIYTVLSGTVNNL